MHWATYWLSIGNIQPADHMFAPLLYPKNYISIQTDKNASTKSVHFYKLGALLDAQPTVILFNELHT